MVQFREVTKENFEEVINLKIKESQNGFLNSNLYSLAEAKVYDDLLPLGVYDDDTLVGFVLLKFFDGPPKYVYIHRFMIDEKFQGKGLGKETLAYTIDYIKKDKDVEYIELMHYPENTLAGKLYGSFGFELTGEIRETETVRVLPVK